jgi:hypothetical protein
VSKAYNSQKPDRVRSTMTSFLFPEKTLGDRRFDMIFDWGIVVAATYAGDLIPAWCTPYALGLAVYSSVEFLREKYS